MTESGVWEAPDQPLRIEYSSTISNQIRIAAVEGYHCVPHGGVEVGGILFGTHQENLVRILAWRPIACEYSKGPSFLLSDRDEAALRESLATYTRDTDLAALEPVGWFHSHTRSEIFLSERDLDLYKRYFPELWQVALVVRPSSFAPTRAGFFFREPDGTVRAQNSYREFQLSPGEAAMEAPAPLSPAEPAKTPPPARKTPAVEEELPHPDESTAALDTPAVPELEAIPAPRTHQRWLWYAAGLAVVIAAIGVGLWQLQSNRRLTLSASDVGGQLHIYWNRSALPVRTATGGTIEIQDGGLRTQVHLTPPDLRTGSISYARQSGDVVVRLRVEAVGEPPLEETTRFLKPGATSRAAPAPVTQPATDAHRDELEREAEAMRLRIDRQNMELSRLQKMVDTIHESRGKSASGQGRSLPATPDRPAQRTAPATAPVVAVKQQENKPEIQPPLQSAPPPQPVVTGSPSQTAAHTGQPQRTAAVVPPPAPAPSAPPPKAVPRPSSGRIIWTGRLSKNGRLVIEGSRSSTGVVNGSLPEAIARVVALPGDLTAQGMTLFSDNLKYTTPLVEPPGAANGWNRTTYTWDPKRASGIRVVEQPSARNGYKLVLQSETSKISVIVMEWRTAQ